MSDVLTVSPVVIERGRDMARIVSHDVSVRGLSRERAIESLADYLGIDVGAVELALAVYVNRHNPYLVRVEA